METLSQWLAQQPAHILLVAVASLALWALCRATVLREAPKANVLWVPAVLWLAYAGWEWGVLARTPEADIRVDLILAPDRHRDALGLLACGSGLVGGPAEGAVTRAARRSGA